MEGDIKAIAKIMLSTGKMTKAEYDLILITAATDEVEARKMIDEATGMKFTLTMIGEK